MEKFLLSDLQNGVLIVVYKINKMINYKILQRISLFVIDTW